MGSQAQETSAQVEEQVKLAKARKELAEAELAEADAKKKLKALTDDPSDKEISETNKAIAEAEKATFEAKKAQWAGPSVTPPTGKITANGEFIETKVLSMKTLKSCMTSLVTKMKDDALFKGKIISVVFYNQSDFPALELYSTLLEQVNGIGVELKKWNKEIADKIAGGPTKAQLNPILVGYAVSGVLKSAAEIVSLFRTTREITNTEISIQETSLASELKSALRADATTEKWKIYIPSMFPVNTFKSVSGSTSLFATAMQNSSSQDETAKKRLKEATDEITKQKEKLKTANEVQKKAISAYISDLQKMVEHLTIVSDAFGKLQNILSTADATTKLTAQAVIMRAEKLISILQQTDSYVVKFVATSKGSNKISESIWRSDRIQHSAGTSLDCLVFNAEGEVVFSFSEINYTPYTSSDQIK